MRAHGRRVLWEGSWWEDATVTIERGRVTSVDRDRGADLEAWVVAPGLIDLQYNGGFGVEIGTNASAVIHTAERLPATGVTAFLPTLVTSPPEVYGLALRAFAEASRCARVRGSIPLGMHLEGPVLSPRFAGAHHREWLDVSAPAFFEDLLAGAREERLPVAIVTLAPELPGAAAGIAELARRGVVVSIGHSAATYEEAIAGVDAGARMVTHLYNAMSPFSHRAPGVVGAALTDDRLTCGVIADGVHVHDAALRLALRTKGPGRIALVTDAMSAAGVGPGEYELAGKRVIVDATSARLADGTLAGSILTLDAAVRNVTALGVPLEDALRMASEVPARLLGLTSKGRLAAGGDGDLVLLDEALAVEATVIGGTVAYARG
jgi:N-acetylglucosamine-6-phosphate deacetylase